MIYVWVPIASLGLYEDLKGSFPPQVLVVTLAINWG